MCHPSFDPTSLVYNAQAIPSRKVVRVDESFAPPDLACPLVASQDIISLVSYLSVFLHSSLGAPR